MRAHVVSGVLRSAPPVSQSVWRERMAQKVTQDLARSSSPLLGRKTRVLIGCILIVVVLAITIPVYFWLVLEPPVKKEPCDVNLSVALGNFTSFPNGSIVDDTGEEYPEGFYFTTGGQVRGCLCSLKPCIRKCCAPKVRFAQQADWSLKCNSEDVYFNKFSLPIYTNPNNISSMTTDDFQILHGGSICQFGKFWLNPSLYPSDLMHLNYLLTDGRILTYGANKEELYTDASEYCLERIDGFEEVYTFICAKRKEDIGLRIQLMVNPVGFVLSIPFLFATLVVYALLPDLHGNLHGQSLMCHVFSLLFSSVTVVVIELWGDHMSDVCCVTLGEYVL